MPIYEYECPACDKVFEVQQRMSDDQLTSCPDCEGHVKKLVSASSFQLKGGGWYSDGYSGPSNGDAKDGKSSGKKKEAVKKDNTATPPCQSESSSCKGCPASSAT